MPDRLWGTERVRILGLRCWGSKVLARGEGGAAIGVLVGMGGRAGEVAGVSIGEVFEHFVGGRRNRVRGKKARGEAEDRKNGQEFAAEKQHREAPRAGEGRARRDLDKRQRSAGDAVQGCSPGDVAKETEVRGRVPFRTDRFNYLPEMDH